MRFSTDGVDHVPHNGIKFLRWGMIVAYKGFAVQGSFPIQPRDLLAQCHYKVMGLTGYMAISYTRYVEQ